MNELRWVLVPQRRGHAYHLFFGDRKMGEVFRHRRERCWGSESVWPCWQRLGTYVSEVAAKRRLYEFACNGLAMDAQVRLEKWAQV